MAAAQMVSIGPRVTAATVVAPGATYSTALRVTNLWEAPVTVTPHIELPADWSAPLGLRPFTLGVGAGDSWIIAVRVPTHAAAGRYYVTVSAVDSASSTTVRDTVTIEVAKHKELNVALTNRPTYAISGDVYRATFLLQNRGNVPATVKLRGSSSLGGTFTLETTRVTLPAGGSVPVVARVATRTVSTQAQDDVFEVYAADAADDTVKAMASARVTIVQEANATEPLHRVAAQLRLRAANSAAGVSPYEFMGGGALRDNGDEQLSFVLRGSPGVMSQFGDQDEYRVELRGKGYAARVGDALYGASSLSSSGQRGFGGGLEVQDGAFGAGAFAQRFRMQFDGPTEGGGFVSADASSLFGAPRFTASAVTRNGGPFGGRIFGTGMKMTPFDANVEVELASSSSDLGRGTATTARINGGDRVRYDLGHVAADDRFAGIYRGAEHNYANVSTRVADDLRVTASVATHQSGGVVSGLLAPQYFRSATLGVNYASRLSLQYSALTRRSRFASTDVHESQHGLLGRVDQAFGAVRVFGGIGGGIASDALHPRQVYSEFTAGTNANIGANSYSIYGETSHGMSITRGANDIVTVGGDARVRLLAGTYLTLNAYSTSIPSLNEHVGQLDAGLSQQLRSGSTVSLRARFVSNPIDVRGKEVAFIEYSMPLQVPIGRIHSAGRVRGRVVDQETGQGVADRLVRLGPQAAITDDQGNVAFSGLAAGEYRLSIAQQQTREPTIFTGNPTVVIDSTRMAPTTFSLEVERAGIVTGTVRQMGIARTGVGSAPDSLADAGPLREVSLALVSARDTLYATTDQTGAYRFAEVTSGTYALKVLSEPNSGTRWEPAEVEVSVKPAETSQAMFRLVPRRRSIQMIPGDTNPGRAK